MARIRSIHPGLFTDEAFASCSPHAQVLFIGIWTECDDNGVFEWKPITLKMRLRPAADVDCGALLDELAANGMIKPLTVGGKSLGLVRNFCKFQRPKKPKAWHVLPPEFRTYVGLSEESSELGGDEQAGVPKKGELDAVQVVSVPKKSEKSPQREEEGGRRKDEGGKREQQEAPRAAAADPALAIIALFDDCRAEVFGEERRRPYPNGKDLPIAREIMASGADMPALRSAFTTVFQRQKARGHQPAEGLSYMRGPVAEAIAKPPDMPRTAGSAATRDRDGEFRVWMQIWQQHRRWVGEGPPPDKPNCIVPERIRSEALEDAA